MPRDSTRDARRRRGDPEHVRGVDRVELVALALGERQRLVEERHGALRITRRIERAATFEQVADAHVGRVVRELRFDRVEHRMRVAEFALQPERARNLRGGLGRFARLRRMACELGAKARFGLCGMVEVPQRVDRLRVVDGGLGHDNLGEKERRQQQESVVSKRSHARILAGATRRTDRAISCADCDKLRRFGDGVSLGPEQVREQAAQTRRRQRFVQ